jgi:hypothetical protein
MDEWVQTQQYQQSVSNYETQIDSQIQGLVGQYGRAVDVDDVLSRMYTQFAQGKPLDANAAFEEQKAVFQRIYAAQHQSPNAPQVLPPGGQVAPTTEKPISQMNESERQAHLVKMLQFTLGE